VEQFELVSGWDFKDATTKNLIRDGGWSLKAVGTGTLQESYMNLTSLGSFLAPLSDNAYYLQSAGGTPVDVVLTGPVNQAIKIYGDGSHGSVDYRTFFKIYLREQGKTYGFYDLIVDQNLTSLDAKKYALPLSNATDLKVTTSDAIIATGATYTGMSINYLTGSGYTTLVSGTTYAPGAVVQTTDNMRWYICTVGGTANGTTTSGFGTATFVSYTGERKIGALWYAFNIIVGGNQGTAEQIYEFLQWSLRQTTDIDDGTGTVRGDTATTLAGFIGDTLKTSTGVAIDNFQAADTNRLQFVDVNGVTRTYPYVAAGTLLFNDNLYNDAASIYRVFFTDDNAGSNLGYDYGTANAITIKNVAGTDLADLVSGRTFVSFDFDYDGNIQRGAGSAGTDAPYTAVALGLTTAQFVVTTGTIIRSTANSVNFVAALERNYTNP